MNPHKSLTEIENRFLPAMGLITLLMVWWFVSLMGIVPIAALPSPGHVVLGFIRMAYRPVEDFSVYDVETTGNALRSFIAYLMDSSPLLGSAVVSTIRILVSVALMAIVGIPIGILLGASRWANRFAAWVVDPLKSAPAAAFLPMFIVWFGMHETMKISFLFFGGVVYLIPMVRDAITSVSKEHYEQAHDSGFTEFETIRHVLIPLAMPRILDAITVCFGIAWTYIVVSEYVNAQNGLGYLIQLSKRLSAMDQIFALVITILILATVNERILRGVKARKYPWAVE